MNSKVKKLFLDENHYHPITIATSAFAEIERLVLAARVCDTCALPYTDETGNRPRVAQNTCLACYLKSQRDTYTFVGKQEAEPKSQYTTYLYLDASGVVHYSHTSSDDDPQESIEMTLRYYGFPVPTSYPEDGQLIELYCGDWYIRGDVTTQSVVVIEFFKRIGDCRHFPFLSYKHGDVILLDKRRGTTRRLYQAAKKQHEASKDQRGYYHLHGREIGHFSETNVYYLVSDLASQEYDTKQQEKLDRQEQRFIEEGRIESHDQLPWNKTHEV
jgi:hypothetical protein